MATTIKHAERALAPAESFVPRHIGPTDADISEMLATLELGHAHLADKLASRAILLAVGDKEIFQRDVPRRGTSLQRQR